MNRRLFLEYGTLLSGLLLSPLAKSNAVKSPAAMKTVGLIGGTSWYSTIDYYRIINELTNQRLGEKINPPLLLTNLNQAHIHNLQALEDWKGIAEIYIKHAKKLITIGADAVVFCARSPQKIADQVQEAIIKPILHIADATAEEIKKGDMKLVGLVGTRFTMTENFFVERLRNYGIETKIPNAKGIEILHNLVINQLANGVFTKESRQTLLTEITKLTDAKVEGIILACTEFPIILKQTDCSYPIFDTTTIHCNYIVDFIISA
ncbi:MAG: amino acid racemase [Cytophagales bacterium]|nr:amino acid racemase [Cytophagales bacterium]